MKIIKSNFVQGESFACGESVCVCALQQIVPFLFALIELRVRFSRRVIGTG